ncbi:N-acyl amino acid synthase FeeM domain-containing protein [Marinagarivorans cellulosilyticus]|uniref:N-acyl amino acid synthase FeeM catalytic core domain-containing protein n=1 Tax=Marinagarivorans cellulosilyticus TaxID=2721545 RepID=A0AAN1WLD4_9GAMM|nr:hypothetical protein [Marinagarivorans cellulosilyticus]BCD99786.1 hypothetical protein MARGE09_P3988 [Marinagarivorans cellulosilyticus]
MSKNTGCNKSEISVVVDDHVREEIKQFRKINLGGIYPHMDLDNDVLDGSALTFYTRANNGEINSTARLTVDNPYGFPQEAYLAEYRARGVRMMELGRFIIKERHQGLEKTYYRTFYNVARNLQCNAIVMSMQPHHVAFHKRMVGLRVLAENTVSYGGPFSLACVVWELDATTPKFFKWLGEQL